MKEIYYDNPLIHFSIYLMRIYDVLDKRSLHITVYHDVRSNNFSNSPDKISLEKWIKMRLPAKARPNFVLLKISFWTK